MKRKTHIIYGGWARGRDIAFLFRYPVIVVEEFVWGHIDWTGKWVSCKAVKLVIEGVTDPIRMSKSIFETLEREALP